MKVAERGGRQGAPWHEHSPLALRWSDEQVAFGQVAVHGRRVEELAAGVADDGLEGAQEVEVGGRGAHVDALPSASSAPPPDGSALVGPAATLTTRRPPGRASK